MDASDAVGFPRHRSVHTGVEEQAAVVDGIVIEVEFVQSGRGAKPQHLRIA